MPQKTKILEAQIKEKIIAILKDPNFGNDSLKRLKAKYLMSNHPKNANRFNFSAKDLNEFFKKKAAAANAKRSMTRFTDAQHDACRAQSRPKLPQFNCTARVIPSCRVLRHSVGLSITRAK